MYSAREEEKKKGIGKEVSPNNSSLLSFQAT
jgi:hypothetical protein